MLVKTVFVFLLAMVAIAMVGRAVQRGLFGPPRRRADLPPPAICGHCRAPIVGDGPCPCTRTH